MRHAAFNIIDERSALKNQNNCLSHLLEANVVINNTVWVQDNNNNNNKKYAYNLRTILWSCDLENLENLK